MVAYVSALFQENKFLGGAGDIGKSGGYGSKWTLGTWRNDGGWYPIFEHHKLMKLTHLIYMPSWSTTPPITLGCMLLHDLTYLPFL
jgi:hypothetical protein